jgi:hypothetical protein
MQGPVTCVCVCVAHLPFIVTYHVLLAHFNLLLLHPVYVFVGKCKDVGKVFQDDGLDKLVCALPPAFTSRFGQVCWAQGGAGFGWWPAFIYDPRLTVGSARQLARKNLGKRHLVYFFECHEAPFCVLTNSKLTIWEHGLIDDYHLGKAAKAAGRARTTIFQQALQAATLEAGKPIDMRLDWNHTEPPPQILPSSPKRKSAIRGNKNGNGKSVIQPDSNGNTKQGSNKRRRDSRGSAERNVASSNNGPSTSSSARRARAFEFLSEPPASGSAERSVASSNNGPSTSRAARRARAFGFLSEPTASESSLLQAAASQMSTRRNLQTAMESLASASGRVAAHIESSEDGELYCKLLKKLPSSEYISNVGFVKLTSRKTCTFAQARKVIDQELVPDCIDADSNWKFFVPTLGPVSLKQEESLGPLFSFLQDTTSDARVGNGSLRHPLKVIIVDSTL